MENIFWILMIFVYISVLGILLITLETWLLAKSKLKPLKTNSIRYNKKLKANKVVHQWAENNDFTFLGVFHIAYNHIATWKYSPKSTFLCLHTFPERSIELITVFENDIILCTGNNSNLQTPPHFFGYYLQTFSRISMDDLWHRHTEMENYLMETGGVKLSESEITIEDCLNSYRKKQTDHIRSFVGWPVRMIYWFLIRQFSWTNKSIKDQYEKGMINLPNEGEN